MPVSLEVALWIVMVGAVVVALWPSNLIGYAESGAERRWARRGGPSRLERLMARAPLVVALTTLVLLALVLWPFVGRWSLFQAAILSAVSFGEARAYRNLLQRRSRPGASL